MTVGWAQLGLQTKEPTDGFAIGLCFLHHGGCVLEGQYERGLMEREHPERTKWTW